MIQFEKTSRQTGWTEGWKDGQTLFHRTLPATAGGSKKEGEKHEWQR